MQLDTSTASAATASTLCALRPLLEGDIGSAESRGTLQMRAGVVVGEAMIVSGEVVRPWGDESGGDDKASPGDATAAALSEARRGRSASAPRNSKRATGMSSHRVPHREAAASIAWRR